MSDVLRPEVPTRPGRALPPRNTFSGLALLALELGREARGIRGLDVLRRSVDRAPPVQV